PALDAGDGTLHLLTLDMADAAAIEAAVPQAFELAGGRLDVIVNNAGYGLLGALADASDDQMEQLFTVDVFGPVRLIRAALPALRAQRSGHILNITSIAGRAPGVGSALYAAAKHALEGLSASLSQELAPVGIKVTAVAPGAFRTDFLSDHSIRRSEGAAEHYGENLGRSLQALDAMAGKQQGDPIRAAEAILEIVDAETPPLHLLLGPDALRRARAKLDTVIDEMDRWEGLTLGTDFPEGE
ncbi:MAG: SDR family NAD(P)-dependent oxidoreductase, partial [Caulobacteraceae bacterium]